MIMEADKSPDLSSASWRPRNSQCFSLRNIRLRPLKVIGHDKLPFWGESEVKVAQSCPTSFSDPMDLCPWNSPGRKTGVGSHFLL